MQRHNIDDPGLTRRLAQLEIELDDANSFLHVERKQGHSIQRRLVDELHHLNACLPLSSQVFLDLPEEKQVDKSLSLSNIRLD